MDWLNPDTLTHWQAILAVIVAIGTPIVAILGWFKPLLRWWRSRFKKKLLSFAQNDVFCFWGEGKLNEAPPEITRKGTYREAPGGRACQFNRRWVAAAT